MALSQREFVSKENGYVISRRDFLRYASLGLISSQLLASLPEDILAFRYVGPVSPETNPLEKYPNRGWEDVYRDLYTPDYTFTFNCAPNCTFCCLLKANVKNDVVLYVDPTYGYGKATDLYGNKVSMRWDPMICPTGHAVARRAYSDRRVKGVYIRKGFLQWVKDGFPRDPETGAPPKRYFEGRGKEPFIKISWEEAYEIVAKTLINIATTYSGEQGMEYLRRQGYDPAMIEKQAGAGVTTLKFRGGMPLLGPFRIGAAYRFANMMALLDQHIRGVGPDKARGGRGWDNYSWHTDLPPGHPMVTGLKTVDFHLSAPEYAGLVICWGMNWISTKMVAAKWLTEAKLKGTKVVVISSDYNATSSKADYVIIVRPASDTAFALGLAHVIIRDKLYDEEFVKTQTDLPLLVRMDNLKILRAKDIIPDYKPAELKNYVKVFEPGEKIPPPAEQSVQYIPRQMREEWDDYVVWDKNTNQPKVITRDDVGERFKELGIDPALEGEFEVETVEGERVKVRPVFDLIKQYLMDQFDPDTVSEITMAPKEAIEELARLIAQNKGKTLFTTGMGVNQFLHGDLKDRAIFLVAALTANVGKIGGNVGSYAGNFKLDIINGIGQWIAENPFDMELDPDKMARLKRYWEPESAHYYAYGDRPLRVGNKLFNGWTHVPTPTKSVMVSNSNSILGNSKWAFNVIVNVLPKIEMYVVLEWFWSLTCEYADIVFGVDSWIERRFPDIVASCTTPFITTWPMSPLGRLFDTRDDFEVWAGIAGAMAKLLGDERFRDYWRFVYENRIEVYINRALKAGNTTKGYTFEMLDEKAREGIPYLYNTKTTPLAVGWEQVHESVPWFTKSGRMEFYREEDEFIEYGENIPVYREPADATPYMPNVIVAKPHPALRPVPPEEYGIDPNDLSPDTRQVRNVIMTWDEVKKTKHPLAELGYTHVLPTPKHRGIVHTIAANVDISAVMFTPFSDPYRQDKRMPWVAEGYVDINPLDGKKLGLDDGDYVWVDGDPSVQPFVGWQDKPEDYKAFRWLARIRFNPSIPPGTAKCWFNYYMASHGSVEGHETREDKLARNPRTGYTASYRYGGHQSITRTWIKPTLLTDSLVRKSGFVSVIGKGYAPDIHTANGAPRESFVKFTKAEAGGLNGKGKWPPAEEGLRPTYESDKVKKYLSGDYVEVE